MQCILVKKKGRIYKDHSKSFLIQMDCIILFNTIVNHSRTALRMKYLRHATYSEEVCSKRVGPILLHK